MIGRKHRRSFPRHSSRRCCRCDLPGISFLSGGVSGGALRRSPGDGPTALPRRPHLAPRHAMIIRCDDRPSAHASTQPAFLLVCKAVVGVENAETETHLLGMHKCTAISGRRASVRCGVNKRVWRNRMMVIQHRQQGITAALRLCLRSIQRVLGGWQSTFFTH